MKADQIFQLPPKIAMNTNVTSEYKLVCEFESYSCLLLTSSRIDRSQIQIQPIEYCVAIGRFAFLRDLAIQLLYQQHGRPPGENVSSLEFLPRRPGSD